MLIIKMNYEGSNFIIEFSWSPSLREVGITTFPFK